MPPASNKSAKNKTPNDGKPKRPLSAYNFFFKEQREEIILHRGGDSGGFASLARTIAARWKACKPEERFVYQTKAAEDKLRYQYAMLSWQAEKRAKVIHDAGAHRFGSPFQQYAGTPTVSMGSQKLCCQQNVHCSCTTSTDASPVSLRVPASGDMILGSNQQMEDQLKERFGGGALFDTNRHRPVEDTHQHAERDHLFISARSLGHESKAQEVTASNHDHGITSRSDFRGVFDDSPLDLEEFPLYGHRLDDETQELFIRMMTNDFLKEYNEN